MTSHSSGKPPIQPMQPLQPPHADRFVLLATGGTIAGTAASADDTLGYRAAQLSGAALLAGLRAAVPALVALPIEVEEVARLDSKDMDFATWQALARAVARHAARAEVRAIVITHGTDTLEETAYFLQRVLAPAKPVVLTAAMRPATAREADGPVNLRDAFAVAAHPQARGVVAVLAGQVWSGLALRKAHTQALDAFTAGGAAPVARVVEGAAGTEVPLQVSLQVPLQVQVLGPWPGGTVAWCTTTPWRAATSAKRSPQ